MKEYRNIEYLLNEGGYIVKNSPKHHLPLYYRNKLLKEIENELIIGRLSILCALKVYTFWLNFKPKDLKIYELLLMAEEYLENKENKEKLFLETGRLQSYISDQNDEEHFDAIYAGYSSVNAAYEVTGKNIEENDLDDFDISSFDWDSAFWANLAYNGGASGFDDIDYNKSKEFWNWYLFEAVKIAYSNNSLVPPLDKKIIKNNSKEFIRSKTDIVNNDIEIKSYVDEIHNKLYKIMPNKNWSKIEYITNVVNNTRQSDLYYYMENQKNNMPIPYGIRHEINSIVQKIKEKVYLIRPEEGTFWTFDLVINIDGSRSVKYLYDTKTEHLQRAFKDYELLDDLKKYPRSNNFTPQWI